jgi:hypothetical protein
MCKECYLSGKKGAEGYMFEKEDEKGNLSDRGEGVYLSE